MNEAEKVNTQLEDNESETIQVKVVGIVPPVDETKVSVVQGEKPSGNATGGQTSGIERSLGGFLGKATTFAKKHAEDISLEKIKEIKDNIVANSKEEKKSVVAETVIDRADSVFAHRKTAKEEKLEEERNIERASDNVALRRMSEIFSELEAEDNHNMIQNFRQVMNSYKEGKLSEAEIVSRLYGSR